MGTRSSSTGGSRPVHAGHTASVEIGPATQAHVHELARLLWLHAAPDERRQQPVDALAAELRSWWADHGSHTAFLARPQDEQAVGMAWVALVPRVPRPGTSTRVSADIQSVYVVPDHRGRGIGSALVHAATEHATRHGAARVTVSSSRRAVPLYERLGFASTPRLLQRPAE
jgi:GNAT superfamily N-acetyltransferase